MSNIECDCGDCRACRRAMGITTVATATVTLSDTTRRILANLDNPAPVPVRPRVQKVVKAKRPAQPRTLDTCKSGRHKLEGNNIYSWKDSAGKTMRECRACRLERRGKTPTQFEKPAMVPCVDCGGMIGARWDGYTGWVVAASDGKCEVCADRPKFEQILTDYETLSGPQRAKRGSAARRARNMLNRVLRDGRAYAPNAPHGTASGYTNNGCRCDTCIAWKTAANRKATA